MRARHSKGDASNIPVERHVCIILDSREFGEEPKILTDAGKEIELVIDMMVLSERELTPIPTKLIDNHPSCHH
jgi:hypothetical protein